MKLTGSGCDLDFTFRSVLSWIYRLSLKRIIKSYSRFELLSPSFSTKQKVLDKSMNEVFCVKIRDNIDLAVINQIFLAEDYRIKGLARFEDISNQYKKILAKGLTPLVLDIGANSGMASIYFAREFPEAKIIAIEPDARNFELAQFNTLDFKNVSILHAGISNKDGKGRVVNLNDDNWAFRTELSESGELEMISINSILENHCDKTIVPFLVKIDIEGFEANLFASSTEWVEKFTLLIIELHDWMIPNTANSSTFLKCISQQNRDFVFRGENVFSIKNNDAISS